MKSGPIILIEDDADDKEFLEDVLKEIGVKNELIWFGNGTEALKYLRQMDKQPFIIFSDVNLPGSSGIECKRQMDKDERLKKKSIPFIFYSTIVNHEAMDEAYRDMTVQGFFKKEASYKEIKKTINLIITYWQKCVHPNLE